ncbi:MAG TPA: aldehyde dehydrogenase family protein [Ilumatobacter sp.]|nr:aldehyde dehydrogenase family protein [Ilumatobacter sp.]
MPVQRIVSPIDGSVVAERPTATAGELERVLALAVAARAAWQATSVAERTIVVEAMVQAMEAEADGIAVELAWQMGRPVTFGAGEIRRGFQERARHMNSVAPTALADVAVDAPAGFRKFIRREPLGTVLVVAPWNYPYLCAVNSVVPALLAGNTVILKHAEQTLLAGERLAAAFATAGLPDGVFQHVVATHDDVATMIADPRVDFVAFTGSVAGGHSIARQAGERFIGTGLELGGKDPAYVRPDADLAYTIGETLDGAFFNSGQSCCAIERIYVHREVYAEFVDGFVEATRAYVLGDPRDPATTLGPMVHAQAAESVRAQVAAAVAAGARALVSEADFAAASLGTPYVGPTVLVDVDHSMAVMRDESFGPVIGIMPVGSDAEAVRLMNDSDYGLTASVWTSDVEAAIAIGDQVATGTAYMNRCDYVDPALVWTGVRNTGRGQALSQFGFEPFTRLKSFHLKTV